MALSALVLSVLPGALSPAAHAQQTKLTADDAAGMEQFGNSVSISAGGERAIVGAHLDDINSNQDEGSAFIFNRNDDGSYTQETKLTGSTLGSAMFPNFGESVSMDGAGERVVVGAWLDDLSGPDTNEGSAFVFSRNSDGSWTEEFTLTADDGAVQDRFGGSVSISADGERIIVGAQLDDAGGNEDQGSAYVFSRNDDGSWTQDDSFTGSALGLATLPQFGFSVSIDDDGARAVIGARFDDTSGGGNTDEGSAYVFSRNDDGSWTEDDKLTADDAAGGERFGNSVSISGSGERAVIGSIFDDVGGNQDQGSAFIFSRNDDGSWSQDQKLAGSGLAGAMFPNFGNSVSMNGAGERVLIGAWVDDAGSGDTNEGSAYVFLRDNDDGSWSEINKLTADDAAEQDRFGTSVAISDDPLRAIVGASRDDDGGSNAGSAYALESGSLPVELASFSTQRDGRSVVLAWQTLSEQNNRGFEIQRRSGTAGASNGGERWQDIEFVGSQAAGGNSTEALTYSYRVENLDYGTHTFRLVQTDLDNTRTPSAERTVEIGLNKQYDLAEVYPNPVRERGTVEIAVRETQEVTVALYDVLGRRMRVLYEGALSGNTTKPLTIQTRGLASGLYFVRVRGEHFAASQKLMLVR